jgi:DNA-binding transcriptional LysR family regulator
MELRHLRYFRAVAEAGHMTRAAAQLGIQQPPLSQQIRALEGELGLVLFKRHPKGVSLTDAGLLFLAEARRLLGDFKAMEQRMATHARGGQTELAVGFTSSAAAHRFTPEALRICRIQHPEIVLRVSESNAAEITEAVVAARLDCGLVRVPVARPPGLVFETLLRENVVVALPIDHPLAKRRRPSARASAQAPARRLRIQDLRDEGLILVRRPGAAGLYANLVALCESRGFRPRVVAEVDRMMSSLNLVAAGAGVSVVPASMQGAHPHAIVYRELAASDVLTAPLTLVYRSADRDGATPTFAALLRQIAKRWKKEG